ncbi:MAG: hypothetical protein RIR79_1399 [Pseudomonadota bacterium]|jgi:hypothetical protein
MNTLNCTQSITPYERDVFAWANEQAAFIRAGRFELLDLENIAEEILDVGKSEQNELANRMAILLMHLIKWEFQPHFRGNSWATTIRNQRKAILKRLKNTPSLKPKIYDAEWMEEVWDDAMEKASGETGIGVDKFPEVCPWDMNDVLQEGWLP